MNSGVYRRKRKRLRPDPHQKTDSQPVISEEVQEEIDENPELVRDRKSVHKPEQLTQAIRVGHL